jgi:repressor LexA
LRIIDEDLLIRVSEFITQYQVKTGESPTHREIMSRLKLTAPRVHRYIHVLESRGMLSLQEDGGIKMPLNLDSSDVKYVPLIGAVRCGEPTLAVEDFDGMFKLPRQFTGSGDFFMLQAKGDSMEGAGIIEGDYLVIKEQGIADAGDIVVAMKESDNAAEEAEATLKRYMITDGRYVLHPENSEYEDIDAEGYRIIGKLVGFFRKV